MDFTRFQEIVPLNAGNVLVIEDNEPAAKWLTLVDQSLNRDSSRRGLKPSGSFGGPFFFQKSSLRKISKSFRTESKRRLKMCNCAPPQLERKYSREFCFRCQQSNVSEYDLSSEEDEDEVTDISSAGYRKYGLVASKQMVGIFVTVWMRTEMVQYVSHMRISSISRGIMGCLGNKVLVE